MTSNLIVLLIAIPLFSSAVLLLTGRKANKWGHLLGTLASASSFGVGVYLFTQMLAQPTAQRALTQKIFSWIDRTSVV
jgi:NADH-quinone oxidoreductase subunit L